MSTKSAKQYGFMQGRAHGSISGIGPSPAVAKEFIDKTPSSKRSQFMKQIKKKGKK